MNLETARLSKNIDFSYNSGLGITDWSEQSWEVPQNSYISISSVTNAEKTVNLSWGKTHIRKSFFPVCQYISQILGNTEEILQNNICQIMVNMKMCKKCEIK